MTIIKRSGKETSFNETKILNAIRKANDSVDAENRLSEDKIQGIVDRIVRYSNKIGRAMTVEEVQDKVEEELIKLKAYLVSKNYIVYRYKKSLLRKKNDLDKKILSLVSGENESIKQENANKNPMVASTQRDYIAGEVSRDITNRILLPKEVVDAHNKGIIHFHDADYFVSKIFNCCLVNLEDMLMNGTVINKTKIDPPNSFMTACNIATQIVAQISSGQYGGQSISLTHLVPFVEVSRKKIRNNLNKMFSDKNIQMLAEVINQMAEEQLKKEIADSMQLITYQLLTLNSVNGQSPFVTIFMYLNEAKNDHDKKDLAMIIEAMLRERIRGVKNEVGAWVSPAFPKLIYVLEEDNISEDQPYWYLTELAAKCTAKRLVPDYISEKVMKSLKLDDKGEGHVFTPMGCRSFLSPWTDKTEISGDKAEHLWDKLLSEHQPVKTECAYGKTYKRIYPKEKIVYPAFGLNGSLKDFEVDFVQKDEDGNTSIHLRYPQFYARFNQGVVSINLPYVALLAKQTGKDFWEVFDEKLELCHKALRCRHERLLGTTSDISPIHWQHGGLARLKPHEKIDKLLYGGYSTISLGYVGLWECVYALTGKKLTDPEGEELGLQIMDKMNDKVLLWKTAENIGYALYGTPAETLAHKFGKAIQKEFGVIEGVSDEIYITNSYHINVKEPVDAFFKLSNEAKFQAKSQGGSISYVETANMNNNVEAILSVIKHIYDTIMYAEINTYSDYCHKCSYDGEISLIKNKQGKYIWKCPNCGNEDLAQMNIVRRVCGYLSAANDVCQGRLGDIHDRVRHL